MAVVVIALQVGEPYQRLTGAGLVWEAETGAWADLPVEQAAGVDAVRPSRAAQTQVMTFGLAPPMIAELDREAAAADFTQSDAIREAREQWVKRQARKTSI